MMHQHHCPDAQSCFAHFQHCNSVRIHGCHLQPGYTLHGDLLALIHIGTDKSFALWVRRLRPDKNKKGDEAEWVQHGKKSLLDGIQGGAPRSRTDLCTQLRMYLESKKYKFFVLTVSGSIPMHVRYPHCQELAKSNQRFCILFHFLNFYLERIDLQHLLAAVQPA